MFLDRTKKPHIPLSDLTNVLLNTCLKPTPSASKIIKVDIPITKNSPPCMKKACESDLENINTTWNSLYGKSFKKILSKLPSTDLL